MSDDDWRTIPGFPNYKISRFGEVYNLKRQSIMSWSLTGFGHAKISLIDEDGVRHTQAVARFVAAAFVEPPDETSDHIIYLDGDYKNLVADNLQWRPRWYTFLYVKQLRERQPSYYLNLPIKNVVAKVKYDCVVKAGMTEGLLFNDIWRSTYMGVSVYPTGSIFSVLK